MRPIINHLIQLQELTIARAQKEVSSTGSQLAELEQAIKDLSGELPDDVHTLFDRIQKKDLLAIVPVAHNTCTGCAMGVPLSVVQHVRLAEKIHTCPHCARILYVPVTTITSKGQRPRRGDPPKVGIERFSSVKLMIPQLEGNTAEEVIQEISACMAEAGFIEDPKGLAEHAMNREAIVSTAVDHAIAFPHVRGVEGGGLALVVGLHKKGIKFGAPGRKLTRIFFFMAIPTASSAFYLKLLSGLSQTFQKEEAREKLFEADTPEKLWKTMVRLTKGKVV